LGFVKAVSDDALRLREFRYGLTAMLFNESSNSDVFCDLSSEKKDYDKENPHWIEKVCHLEK